MKRLKKIMLQGLILFNGLSLSAQNHAIYLGGNGDGFTKATYIQAVNNGIYSGSTGDGFDLTSFAQSRNNDIYAGGEADGFSFNSHTPPLNNSIYAGGDADGFSSVAYTSVFNNNIYAGGNADGFSTTVYGQPLNNSIYAGGTADGFSLIAYAQPLNNAVFVGGNGDGFDTKTYQTTISEIAIRVMLQGPFETSTQDMTTYLNSLPDFPLIEPYTNLGYILQNAGVSILNTAPFYGDIVDWIVVELRTPSNTIVLTRTALLLKDGLAVDVNGSPSIKFSNLMAGDYHVLVRHRNHLGVMTAGTVRMPTNDN